MSSYARQSVGVFGISSLSVHRLATVATLLGLLAGRLAAVAVVWGRLAAVVGFQTPVWAAVALAAAELCRGGFAVDV